MDPESPLFSFNGITREHAVKPTDVGNDVDDICNNYFLGKKSKPPMYLDDKMVLFVQDTLKKRIMPILSSYGIKVSDPKRQIKPQYKMISRSMNDDFREVLKKSSKEFVSGNVKHMAKEISVIEGIADLVIVDDNGVVHLVDFKT